MDGDIEIISDGHGMAVLGEEGAVDRFLRSEGLESRDLGLDRFRSFVGTGAAAAQAGSEISANAGRWVKLTKESAQAVERHGLRQSLKSGLSTGVLKGDKGRIKGYVEFVRGPGTLLSNPAVLAGAGSIMAQLAMQQAMDEITDYLATIDEKVDAILRAQKDTVFARMIGAGLVIDEAMTLRKHRGRVDEITWSKVQVVPATIAETQAYALRQLDAIAEKLESKTKMDDLAKAIKDAEPKVREWLAVLARCFQLQDGLAVLELDRVLDASPEELDGHRLGLREAREDRVALITRSTDLLIQRMAVAARKANAKVLLHPSDARSIVTSSNQVNLKVADFRDLLGIDYGRTEIEARRWREAVGDVRDRALETAGEGVGSVRRGGARAAGQAKSSAEQVKERTGRITERAVDLSGRGAKSIRRKGER